MFWWGKIEINKLSYKPTIKYKSIIISSSKIHYNKSYNFMIGGRIKTIKTNKESLTKINKFI